MTDDDIRDRVSMTRQAARTGVESNSAHAPWAHRKPEERHRTWSPQSLTLTLQSAVPIAHSIRPPAVFAGGFRDTLTPA